MTIKEIPDDDIGDRQAGLEETSRLLLRLVQEQLSSLGRGDIESALARWSEQPPARLIVPSQETWLTGGPEVSAFLEQNRRLLERVRLSVEGADTEVDLPGGTARAFVGVDIAVDDDLEVEFAGPLPSRAAICIDFRVDFRRAETRTADWLITSVVLSFGGDNESGATGV